jgi:hypothetical protein
MESLLVWSIGRRVAPRGAPPRAGIPASLPQYCPVGEVGPALPGRWT